MNCQACGRPLAKYDEHRVACKAGHVWTLPEFSDLPPVGSPTTVAAPLVAYPPPEKPRRSVPAWLPGTVLGVLALIGEVILWLH